MCWIQIEKDFHKHNRRYIYNIQNHIWVKDRKDRIIQFFSHIFRRRTYEFVIVNLVDTVKQILNEKDSWTLRIIQYWIFLCSNYFRFKLFTIFRSLKRSCFIFFQRQVNSIDRTMQMRNIFLSVIEIWFIFDDTEIVWKWFSTK